MTTVTVATYNLYLGADVSVLFDAGSVEELAMSVRQVREQLDTTHFPERAGALARLFARERIDVVGLQEVTRWSTSPILADGSLGPTEVISDFLPELLTALEEAGTPYDAHAVTTNFHGALPVDAETWMGIEGANALLVRRDGPVLVTAERTRPFGYVFEVETGLDGVSFPIHRSYGWADAECDGRAFRVVNAHTEAYGDKARDTQRDELLAAVGDPGVPVVIGGDFNTTPDAVGIGAPYLDAWLAAGGDPKAGATFGQRADLLNEESTMVERIDYLFVRDAEVVECQVVGVSAGDRTSPHGLWPSDHAGVVARIEF